MASLYLSISDIATTLDIPVNVLRVDVNNRNTEVYKAYNRGKVATKVELRKQEVMLAKVGSPLALDTLHKALLDMEDDE